MTPAGGMGVKPRSLTVAARIGTLRPAPYRAATVRERSLRALVFVLVAALPSAWGQIAKPAGAVEPVAALNPVKSLRIAPQALVALEKSFDSKLATLAGADDPVDVLGLTRGIYLDGYGIFFSTDISLVVTPELNPFRREISKELAAHVRQRRVERLPLLKTA